MGHLSLNNQRILLVDDDEIFSVMVAAFLSKKSVVFQSVGDLSQARQLLQTTSFDLILLDNYLPDGFGVELMGFLQQQHIELPVIMITADDDQVSMQKCFENGVSDYILKPINLQLMWLKMVRCINAAIIEEKLNEQNEKLERLLDEKQHEENLARHVYKHFTSSTKDSTQGIQTYLKSSGSFNGDFFLEAISPEGNYLILLVDATGHGLAAAMSVLPVLSTSRAMIKKGFSLEHLLYEINSKIYIEIPDDRFVACIGIEMDFQRQEMSFFNGGMPDILVLDSECQIKNKIKSNCLPLGILSSKEFSPNMQKRAFTKGEHLMFYSDGLTEQRSANNEVFGHSQFLATLRQCQSANELLPRMEQAFRLFKGDMPLEDDVSICTVDFDALIPAVESTANKNELVLTKNESQVKVNVELSGGLLSTTNVVSLFDEILKTIGANVPLRQKSFTIFSELVNNGLDHGILKLDSELKNDIEGFATYLEEREQRLNTLKSEDSLSLELIYRHPNESLTFSVEDSGEGYEFETKEQTMQPALSGRGVNLVKKLSEQFIVHKPGNKTSVLIK